MSDTLVHIDGEPVGEKDLLFNAYLDGELSEEDALVFEERMESEPDLAREFELYASIVAGLGEMPRVRAPDDFVDTVAGQIRQRSRGRFFGETMYRSSVPLELVAVLMLAIMASTYVALDTHKGHQVEDYVVRADAPVLSPSRP